MSVAVMDMRNWHINPCAKGTQHCWMLLVASVCTPCCLLLHAVGSCCAKFVSYFYRILNNENFKMEGEQTNLVTHLTITVQY